jgi:hypothetical protein
MGRLYISVVRPSAGTCPGVHTDIPSICPSVCASVRPSDVGKCGLVVVHILQLERFVVPVEARDGGWW